MTKPSSWLGTVAVLAACVGVLALVRGQFGGVAPTPEAFASRATLESALGASAESGRPVLAFATADWCGPCQSFKRGALADERVASWIAENTIPAYVDLTGDDEGALEAARLLSISSVPALLLIEDGEVVARLEGAFPAERVLAWLREAAVTPAG